MPIPTSHEEPHRCSPRGKAGKSVSLTVLAPHSGTKVRASKMGPRRAIVLIAVHALIAIHILTWYLGGKGRTISPVEPSESMYTIDEGRLNAGFIFFGLAILSTALLGRFFCGWGCHIVALQDFCGWLMKKCGVHPKPFRSRLLAWAPLLLALYMFFWPTFKREVIKPIAGADWPAIRGYFGEPPPRPTLRAEFTKAAFWETFETRWYVLIPFFGICGFATVYFLGAKGFCMYGCPYGGFFSPVDKLAVGRIRVTDACEHCGHCTAVCTSNVRVHQEVRDFGMVVDPGCMKCMDCISVCPNDALYFGFGRPALGAPVRTVKTDAAGAAAASAPERPRPSSPAPDLTWPQEIILFCLAYALFWGFRGMLGMVPLLLAVAMAGIGAFLTWKFYALLRTPNVRIQSLQLKLKGRIKPWGITFGSLAVLALVSGGWGLARRYHISMAGLIDDRIATPYETVFGDGYTPSDSDKGPALRALAHFRAADSPSAGGHGWALDLEQTRRSAWLMAVAGDLDSARAAFLRGIAIGASTRHGTPQDLVGTYGTVLRLQGYDPPRVAAAVEELIRRFPGQANLYLQLANVQAYMGQREPALASLDLALAAAPTDPEIVRHAAEALAGAGEPGRAAAALQTAVAAHPDNAQLHLMLGTAHAILNRPEEALSELRAATRLAPKNPEAWSRLAQILDAMGRSEEAATAARTAADLMKPPLTR